MSILMDSNDILNEGDIFAKFFQSIEVCCKLFNECKSKRDHNVACKFLVSEFCDKKLNLDDVNFKLKRIPKITSTFMTFFDLRHTILAYTPPKGGRSALINVLNIDKNIDNIKFETNNCIFELGEYHVDKYDDTVFYDISDKKLIFKEIYKNLKIRT